MEFKKILSELIKQNDMTKASLSRQTGISTSTIQSWYSMDCEPKPTQLMKIADFFQVSTDYLLGREDYAGVVTIPEQSTLTRQERVILDLYNQLNHDNRIMVAGYMTGLLKAQA